MRTLNGENERDEAMEEAQIARLDVVTVGGARERAQDDLARVRDALAVAEEAKRKTEAKTARLEVERTSLLLELEAAKDEVSFLQSQASKNKKSMEEDY